MGEFGKLLLDSVKWLASLRTAAQQLVAALFLLVGILMGVIYFLYKQNIADRATYEVALAKARSEARSDIAAERLKTDAAMKAAENCMVEKFDMVSQLLEEQRAINRQEQPLAETRQNLAKNNEKYIKNLKKQTQSLVETAVKTIQQKQ